MIDNNNEKNKNLIIRSSSAEFLIFEMQKKEKGIQVRFEEGDLWLTQKALGELFDTTRNNITMHIQDIYNNNELDEIWTSKDFLLVQKEGSREVKRNVKYYNLDAVISVGYRVNSDRAIQFRRWATNVLKQFAKIWILLKVWKIKKKLILKENGSEKTTKKLCKREYNLMIKNIINRIKEDDINWMQKDN